MHFHGFMDVFIQLVVGYKIPSRWPLFFLHQLDLVGAYTICFSIIISCLSFSGLYFAFFFSAYHVHYIIIIFHFPSNYLLNRLHQKSFEKRGVFGLKETDAYGLVSTFWKTSVWISTKNMILLEMIIYNHIAHISIYSIIIIPIFFKYLIVCGITFGGSCSCLNTYVMGHSTSQNNYVGFAFLILTKTWTGILLHTRYCQLTVFLVLTNA